MSPCSILTTQGEAIRQRFLTNCRQAYEALEFTIQRIEELEETLSLLQEKRMWLEVFMIKEGYM